MPFVVGAATGDYRAIGATYDFSWYVQSQVPGPITGNVIVRSNGLGSILQLISTGYNTGDCNLCTTNNNYGPFFHSKSNKWETIVKYNSVNYTGSVYCSVMETDLKSMANNVLITNTDPKYGNKVPMRMYVNLPSNNSYDSCMTDLDADHFYAVVINRSKQNISGKVLVNGIYTLVLDGLEPNHSTKLFLVISQVQNDWIHITDQWNANLSNNNQQYQLTDTVNQEHGDRFCMISQKDANTSLVQPVQIFIDGNDNGLTTMTVNPPNSGNCKFDFKSISYIR